MDNKAKVDICGRIGAKPEYPEGGSKIGVASSIGGLTPSG